ncbi:MAG: hypothetical protein N2257_07105 [Thermodesulfovibrionales bacterium]|nr:hypothetical protein [Thermodesulfovibrionales bacterium]
MIDYRIIHHSPGLLKVEIPAIKNISRIKLKQISSYITVPEGIRSIRPDIFKGIVVIKYEDGKIDILNHLQHFLSKKEIQNYINED